MRLIPGLLLVCALATSCSHGRFDPFQHGAGYDEAWKHFTRSLRWNQLAMASEHVDPDVRERFLDEARAFAGLRFSDYDVLMEDLDESFDHATVAVEFKAYDMTTMIERSITVHQEWRRDRESGHWWVTPEIRGDWLPAKAATP